MFIYSLKEFKKSFHPLLWILEGRGSPRTHQHLPEAISNAYVELFPLGHKDEPALRHLTDLVQHGLVGGPDPYLLQPQPKSNVSPTAQSTQNFRDSGGQKVTLGWYPSSSGCPQVRGVKVVEVSTWGLQGPTDTDPCTQRADGEDFLTCHPPLHPYSRLSHLGQLDTYPGRGTHGSWGTWGARWARRTRNTDSYKRNGALNS